MRMLIVAMMKWRVWNELKVKQIGFQEAAAANWISKLVTMTDRIEVNQANTQQIERKKTETCFFSKTNNTFFGSMVLFPRTAYSANAVRFVRVVIVTSVIDSYKRCAVWHYNAFLLSGQNVVFVWLKAASRLYSSIKLAQKLFVAHYQVGLPHTGLRVRYLARSTLWSV